MTNSWRLASVAAVVLCLSGCVATLPVGVVKPDGGLQAFDPNQPLPASSNETQLRFRLRVTGASASAAPNMAALLASYSPLTSVSADEPKPDIELRWTFNTGTTGVRLEAVSAYTDQTLFRCQDAWWTQASAGRNLGSMIYAAFVPGGPLYKQVVAERAGARQAPAPAAAASMTPEQIAQIVQQTMKEQGRGAAPAAIENEAPLYSLPQDPKKFAVIVGVENYVDLPAATFAERDAAAVKSHALALGFPERNILYLTGARATKGGLVKSLESWLPRNVADDSTVLFYFSGHGAPDPATGRAYVVPSDGDPQFLEDTAYPTQRLYAELGKLKAKSVLVVMDACFSGSGGRSVLAKGTRPLVNTVDLGRPRGGVISLAASAANE
ncbi:MAG: caspase family protein, partial [Elusimicrobia bacterium]|nr:caspase family protein [Elusimicrobiota bacterium]